MASPALSPTMTAVLGVIAERHRKANEAELARWLSPLAGGVCVDDLPSRTVLALESRGAILLRRVVHHGSRLRSTGFGRWNGAERTTWVSLHATPTPAQ